MVGFKNKPFYLPRTIIKPPLELQRKVLPCIEAVYACQPQWQDICRREMDEYDDNHDNGEEADKDLAQLDVVEEDDLGGSAEQARQQQPEPAAQVSPSDIKKRGYNCK
ncbi:hypothetical protein [Parasitella parasitica]|uniref:Uncharacterized protein n=1 Tax=Parasitella parasitica TaxID=35722 RepID=A0A0B7NH56_9FUNG|nr:hypothetical protein [Parasitella parasitica]